MWERKSPNEYEGGFAADNATLERFFALHFLIPFVIAAIVNPYPANVENMVSS
jgi:hypothetical protein